MFFSCTPPLRCQQRLLTISKRVTPAKIHYWVSTEGECCCCCRCQPTSASKMGGIATDWEEDEDFRLRLSCIKSCKDKLVSSSYPTTCLAYSRAMFLLPQPSTSYSCSKLKLLVKLHDTKGKNYGLNIRIGKSNRSICDVLQQIIIL